MLEKLVVEACPSEVRPVTLIVPELVALANAAVPVNVGPAESTMLPVPVTALESVTPPYVRAFTSVSAPVEEKEEVAVAPKYALLKTENAVEEALPNVESPVTDTVPSVLILLPMVVAACATVAINSTDKTTEKITGIRVLRNFATFDMNILKLRK